MLNQDKSLLTIILCIVTGLGYSAHGVNVDVDKKIAIEALSKMFDAYSFPLASKVEFPNGKTRYKLSQYYRSLLVWNTGIVTTKEDIKNLTETEIISGRFYTHIENDIPSVVPQISEAEAIKIATNQNMKNKIDIKSISVELIIVVYDQVAKLVYLINYFVDDEIPKRPYFIIDANTGKILQQWEGLPYSTYQNAYGPGGNEKIGKYYYGSDYTPLVVDLDCNMVSPNVVTYDMNNTKNNEKLYNFTCPYSPGRYANGAYSPINDAHYFGNMTYDMYHEWFNTKVYPRKLKIRVHYGKGFGNAFWDGKQITFGDGNQQFFPFVSADLVAHEISHGFTENNSNLKYDKQAGAISESFSDIAGEMAKYFLKKNHPRERNDWIVGATVTKAPLEVGLRYISDPKRDGKSIDHAYNYSDLLDVHHSSGVFNKAFYILANQKNWNLQKTFQTLIVANQLYWRQDIDFNEGACGILHAAHDLEYNTEDVQKSFKQVGISINGGNKGCDI